jgi:hypothetical protein
MVRSPVEWAVAFPEFLLPRHVIPHWGGLGLDSVVPSVEAPDLSRSKRDFFAPQLGEWQAAGFSRMFRYCLSVAMSK